MASVIGFEPTAFRLGGEPSILLRYTDVFLLENGREVRFQARLSFYHIFFVFSIRNIKLFDISEKISVLLALLL